MIVEKRCLEKKVGIEMFEVKVSVFFRLIFEKYLFQYFKSVNSNAAATWYAEIRIENVMENET